MSHRKVGYLSQHIGTQRPVTRTFFHASVASSLEGSFTLIAISHDKQITALGASSKDMNQIEYERLAYGHYALSNIPKLSPWRLASALRAYSKAIKLYRLQGYAPTVAYLENLSATVNSPSSLASIEALRLARENMLPFAILGKVLGQPNNCLAMTLSYTAAFIVLGLTAKTVIGKSMFVTHEAYTFHAWIEVNGLPVFEDESIRSHYWVLDIIPD